MTQYFWWNKYFLKNEHRNSGTFFSVQSWTIWTKKGWMFNVCITWEVSEPPSFHTVLSSVSAHSRVSSCMSMKWFFTLCVKFCFWGATNEDIGIVLQCLDVMFAKRRKKVSQQRALAFLKRLSILALHVLPDSSIGILATNRVFMQVSFTCSNFFSLLAKS